MISFNNNKNRYKWLIFDMILSNLNDNHFKLILVVLLASLYFVNIIVVSQALRMMYLDNNVANTREKYFIQE